jgi:PAS domain S-box-containing protein
LKTFRTRRFLIFIFVFFSISLSYLSYFYVRDWGLAKAQDYTSSQLLNTVTAVRSALNKFHVLPSLISKQLDVQALLLAPNKQHLLRVRNYLEQTNVIAGSASMLVLNKSAQVVAQSNWRNQEAPVVDSYANSDFFLKTLKGEQSSGVWFGERSGVWFYFSAPIYQRQTLVGVVVVRIDVAKTLEGTVTREDFYLTDNADNLVYSSFIADKHLSLHSKPPFVATDIQDARIEDSYIETLLDGTQLKIVKQSNQSFLVQQVLLDDTQWSIGVLTPLNVLKSARWSALGVFSGCMLLGLLVMYIREWRAKKRTQLEVVAAQLASEARGRHIINTTQSGLITLDARGNITFINPLVMQQFGISLSNVINQPLAILFDQLASFTSLKRVLDNLADQTTSNFSPLTGYEVVAKRSDNSIFPAMLSIKQMRTDPVAEYLVTLVDITKRKQLERSLKEVNESLEEQVIRRTIALENTQAELLKVEKMAVLGRMSTAIVHEINQPLTALRNYLAILVRIKHQPELMDQPLGALNHLVDNMAGITRQLKMFAYAKNEPQERVDLVALIDSVLVLIAPQMQQNRVELKSDFSTLGKGDQLAARAVVILGDRLRLEQVLHNLLSNAVDAMNDKQYKMIDIALMIEGDSAQIIITDTGGGADEEQLAQIFEPFYTTKEMGLGLGLGLSIVKNIVSDLGGNINAKNTHNGLMFTLRFPLL